MISLAILAAGAGVLMQRSRALMDYAQRSRRHYEAASELLSKAARLPTIDFAATSLVRTSDRLILHPSGPDQFPLSIRNFALHGVAVPISQAIAPFQIYELDSPVERKLALLLSEPIKPLEDGR